MVDDPRFRVSGTTRNLPPRGRRTVGTLVRAIPFAAVTVLVVSTMETRNRHATDYPQSVYQQTVMTDATNIEGLPDAVDRGGSGVGQQATLAGDDNSDRTDGVRPAIHV
jgi:hypothetical protein